eukprot:1731222-Rhodomonas_salina.1
MPILQKKTQNGRKGSYVVEASVTLTEILRCVPVRSDSNFPLRLTDLEDAAKKIAVRDTSTEYLHPSFLPRVAKGVEGDASHVAGIAGFLFPQEITCTRVHVHVYPPAGTRVCHGAASHGLRHSPRPPGVTVERHWPHQGHWQAGALPSGCSDSEDRDSVAQPEPEAH